MEVNTRDQFERLKVLKEFKAVIRSDSMEPFLKVGDQITVDVGVKDLKRFDLIIFWRNNQMFCHCLWTMNRFMEPIFLQSRCIKYQDREHPIRFEDYLGKVTSHELPIRFKLKIMIKEMFTR